MGKKKNLILIGLDSIWLQPVMTPKWVRGAPEYAHIESTPEIQFQSL